MGDDEVELLEVYYKDEPEDGVKPHKKPDGIRVKSRLQPGELVGGIPIAQAPTGTIPIVREDYSYGYIKVENLQLVGEPGWGMDESPGLELYDPEED